jgi:hypothetical protein
MDRVKKAPRVIVTPHEVLVLFMSGKNTAEIAKQLGVKESEVYKVLSFSREVQRLFNDPDHSRPPAVREQVVGRK